MTPPSSPLPLHFASACAESPNAATALGEAFTRAREQLAGHSISFALVFMSAPRLFEQRTELNAAVEWVCDEIGHEALIGCSASGVIGGQSELEETPGCTVLLGSLKGAEVEAYHWTEAARRTWTNGWPEGEARAPRALRSEPLLMLADPFTFDIVRFLRSLDSEAPALRAIGGLASGAPAPGLNLLIRGRLVTNHGCVALQLRGPFLFESVVSQGCRPVGRPAIVTSGKGNLIKTLRGQRPERLLKELIDELAPRDRELMKTSLLIGRVIDEQAHRFGPGDFLVRPIVRLASDGLIIGDVVRVGQTVQFHVRDAQTATEELDSMLEQTAPDSAAALLFSCAGRGQSLFGEAGHETTAIKRALGSIPIGGFFCGGEIGAIGDRHFLHGFTSCLGLFRPLSEAH